jgi:hypothetical protein
MPKRLDRSRRSSANRTEDTKRRLREARSLQARRGASGQNNAVELSGGFYPRQGKVVRGQVPEMPRKVSRPRDPTLTNFSFRAIIRYGYSDCHELVRPGKLGANRHATLTATGRPHLSKFYVGNLQDVPSGFTADPSNRRKNAGLEHCALREPRRPLLKLESTAAELLAAELCLTIPSTTHPMF